MGYKIKEIRESLKMTQEELSAQSGVSRSIIVALENDNSTVTTTKTLQKIAQALGVSITQIFFTKDV